MIELERLKQQIVPWLKGLQSASQPGAFHISQKGQLFVPSSSQGLGFSSLALKTAYTINALDAFSAEEKKSWANFIGSFQNPSGIMAGYFEDKGLLEAVDGLKIRSFHIKGPFKHIKNMEVRSAETRQALAALLGLDTKAGIHIPFVPKTKQDAVEFFHRQPWSNPWAAGSQMGHVLFFLKYNRDHFNLADEANVEAAIWKELAKIQNKDDGAWYTGNPSRPVIINGVMKVLISYNLYKKEIEWPEKLIDLCLGTITKSDGCHLLDQVYVLHSCLKHTSHRKEEIKVFAHDLNFRVKRHFNEDGAFSFYPNQSQTSYYGKKVTKGLPVSDIHGTHLFTWTLVLLDDILNDMKGSEWKHPIT